MQLDTVPGHNAEARPVPQALPTPLEFLASRMRSGDREAVAAFVSEYGPLIRRRVRGKLSAATRRLFDSQEILSTLSRRLDLYVRAGRLEATSESQLWALVFKMADAALIDKVRVTQRLRSVEGEDSPLAAAMLARFDRSARRSSDGPEFELDELLRSLPTAADRQLLSLWLLGNSLKVIGEHLGVPADTARQRWHTLRERLRGSLLQEMA
ncbi:MAG: sigma-70 family RNA polymerase sigma factor [Phycisphaerales bacterium]|nr:sigma-70 family RNA polymerase sigma factor [Phycisphaerales bacterium]